MIRDPHPEIRADRRLPIGHHLDDLVQWVLAHACNILVTYRLRGTDGRLNEILNWKAPEGSGDKHDTFDGGSLSRMDARRIEADGYQPAVDIVPIQASDKPRVLAVLQAKLASLHRTYACRAVEDRDSELRLVIPEALRVGHAAHFAPVTSAFLRFLLDRRAIPRWVAQ
ncbi:putative oxidoreductase C-terminal domain-containing protein [Pendulispora albinea]|uniref:Putative oxidoreductase C-terminal domain-containing protein n=1 Tax=Pendulispora albinea TaxID=2741071 RepID=A0ABZ2LSQ6_9BACT